MVQREDKQTRTFREILAKYKARHRLTVDEMCELLGIGHSTYHAMQKDVGRVDIRLLRRMRVALQIPTDELKDVI